MVDAVRGIRTVRRAVVVAPESPKFVKAASISVMTTVATTASLRTMRIMTPTVVAGEVAKQARRAAS
jgi:hypothetical protein